MVDQLDLLTRRYTKGAEYIVESEARFTDVIGNVMNECLKQAKELGYEFPEANEVAYEMMKQQTDLYVERGLKTLQYACERLEKDIMEEAL